jgi:hypothetical protein
LRAKGMRCDSWLRGAGWGLRPLVRLLSEVAFFGADRQLPG